MNSPIIFAHSRPRGSSVDLGAKCTHRKPNLRHPHAQSVQIRLSLHAQSAPKQRLRSRLHTRRFRNRVISELQIVQGRMSLRSAGREEGMVGRVRDAHNARKYGRMRDAHRAHCTRCTESYEVGQRSAEHAKSKNSLPIVVQGYESHTLQR
ncbi:hypothetical protein L7F22_059857 [Adiantum nelumboides]|nr:hypothetical protein [Adiantum nelumboides]